MNGNLGISVNDVQIELVVYNYLVSIRFTISPVIVVVYSIFGQERFVEILDFFI